MKMSITYNWQYTYVHYIATQWQSQQKHHVVESNITCLKYADALAKARKMADSCTSNFDENSVAL